VRFVEEHLSVEAGDPYPSIFVSAGEQLAIRENATEYTYASCSPGSPPTGVSGSAEGGADGSQSTILASLLHSSTAPSVPAAMATVRRHGDGEEFALGLFQDDLLDSPGVVFFSTSFVPGLARGSDCVHFATSVDKASSDLLEIEIGRGSKLGRVGN
jgi:hypothetical protein